MSDISDDRRLDFIHTELANAQNALRVAAALFIHIPPYEPAEQQKSNYSISNRSLRIE